MGALPATARARVALVFDYEASWITRIQPQGADFSYLELTVRWYEAVRRLGLDVDILAAGAELAGYALVLVPTLPHVGEAAAAAFARAEGCVLFGPRSGSKTRHFGIPDNLPPGPLASLVPVRVIEVASLRPGLRDEVSGSATGAAERWRDGSKRPAPSKSTRASRTATPRSFARGAVVLGMLARCDAAGERHAGDGGAGGITD